LLCTCGGICDKKRNKKYQKFEHWRKNENQKKAAAPDEVRLGEMINYF
jgi:hypothetical protein